MPPRRSSDSDAQSAGSGGARVLKKYPNRRLYDTRASSYITLADVKQMVLDGESFEVRDAKTGEEITRSILLQIIVEEETGGVPMFSSKMLEQMIRFYGFAIQGLIGAYLEQNLQAFVELQRRFTEQGKGLYEAKAVFTPEAWSQFMSGQAPSVQNLMGNWLEQSRSLLEQMQQQIDSGALFPAVRAFGAKR